MFIKRVLAALVVVLCFGTAAQEGVLVNNHERAEQLRSEGQWQPLLDHLQRWQDEGDNDPQIFRWRAEALQQTGRTEEAITALKEWLKETPEDQRVQYADILGRLGDLYAENDNVDAALTSYRRANAIRENALTHLQLARLFTTLPGQEAEADKEWRKTLAYGEHINEAGLWREFAEFHSAQDNAAETYKAFEHVARLVPDDLTAWQRLFLLADKLDKKAAQKLIVSRLTRIDSRNPLANAYLGQDAAKRGDKQMARYYFDIAVSAPEEGAFMKWRAIALFGLAQSTASRKGAFQLYRSALLADPALFDAWESAIILLRRMRRTREAKTYTERFLAVKRQLAENKNRPIPDALLAGI